MNAATPEALEQAQKLVTPEMLAAAWGAWHSRHGGKIGPGPAFAEAIAAALAASSFPADLKAAEDSNDALNEKLHALAPHGSCACSYDKPGDVCMHHSPALAAAEARAAQLQAEVEALKEDAARLDFLDGCNARLNASYGTHYGWKLVLNHNVNRLMLGDMKVDLHDSEGGNDKLPSCRLAIDEARARTALAPRAATAREGQADG